MNSTTRNIFIHTLLPALAGFGAMWLLLLASMDFTSSQAAFSDALISIFLLTLGAIIINNILRYYRPSGRQVWTLGTWILLVTLLWMVASVGLLRFFISDGFYQDRFIDSSLPLRFVMGVIILVCVSLITWVKRQSESDVQSIERYNEMQQLAREAELHSLRQQLQPHFLFNSLNSIQVLIDADPVLARKMVIQLSEYLRGTLKKGQQTKHTVAEELENTRLYLEIEKIRFGQRLQVHTTIPDSELLNSRTIPAIILQPLVENAVKHGIYQTTGPVTIDLQVAFEENQTIFQISNPFDPTTHVKGKGTGFGLSSLKRRMYLLYGRDNLVQNHSEKNIYTVKIIIPTP